MKKFFAVMLAIVLAGVSSRAFAFSITGGFDNHKIGEPYSIISGQIEAEDRFSYYWFGEVVEGALPDGLHLVSSSGCWWLEGTPTRAGTFTFTLMITRTDPPNPDEIVTKEFSVTILNDPNVTAPEIYGTFNAPVINVPYSESISVGNGQSPYTWSYEGSIPDGMNLQENGNKYILSGTPTATGTYSLTVTVTDNYGSSASKSLDVIVTDGSSNPDNGGTSDNSGSTNNNGGSTNNNGGTTNNNGGTTNNNTGTQTNGNNGSGNGGSGDSGSSGGCDSGFSAGMLALCAAFLLRRKS